MSIYKYVFHLPSILYLLLILFLFQGCSSISIFYDYAPLAFKWELDSYFDLSSDQENWIDKRLKIHFEWHRKEELPIYVDFLQEVQRRGVDGLTLSELEEGNEKIQRLWYRIIDKLINDCVYFLANLESQQINHLETKLNEKNLELEKSMKENHLEMQVKRFEAFTDSLEDWFGDLSKSQKKDLERMHSNWNNFRKNPYIARYLIRKERQQNFLSFLRRNPSRQELKEWLAYWFRNWSESNNSNALKMRKKRIRRYMHRILQVDSLFTPIQRKHAIKEIQDWIDQMKRAIPNQ